MNAHDVASSRAGIIEFLVAHDTQTTPHIFGDLFAHLIGVEALVKQWGGSDVLALAALAHATYGTDGFEPSLLTTAQRSTLADVVGPEVESFVYLYAACDRDVFYPELAEAARANGGEARPRYRDRFTGEEFVPTPATVRDFCDLTFANEVELAASSPGGPREWTWLAEFCLKTRALASPTFWLGASHVLGIDS